MGGCGHCNGTRWRLAVTRCEKCGGVGRITTKYNTDTGPSVWVDRCGDCVGVGYHTKVETCVACGPPIKDNPKGD